MYFLVIEGDNGTGKDSLAQKFQIDGFEIITYDENIKKMEKIARTFNGKDKVLHFMAYNKACGDLAKKEKKKNNVLLVRYFVSSLAATYADNVFSADKTMKLFDMTYNQFEKPDAIIRLKCDSDKRIKRIEERNSKIFDDKTLIREEKYRWITEKIKEKMDEKWIEINTSNMSIDEVYDCAKKELNNLYKDNIEK